MLLNSLSIYRIEIANSNAVKTCMDRNVKTGKERTSFLFKTIDIIDKNDETILFIITDLST